MEAKSLNRSYDSGGLPGEKLTYNKPFRIYPEGFVVNRDTNAAINILDLVKQTRDGQSRSNANGLETSTLLGETLVAARI
jgi:hypothetical protein